MTTVLCFLALFFGQKADKAAKEDAPLVMNYVVDAEAPASLTIDGVTYSCKSAAGCKFITKGGGTTIIFTPKAVAASKAQKQK